MTPELRPSREPVSPSGTERVDPHVSTHLVSTSKVRFVDDACREELTHAATRARWVVLRPRAEKRSSIARAIDSDLESALAVRGAHPDLTNDTDLVRCLDRQLDRARHAGVRGVCLALPTLAPIADEDGVIDAGDARYLQAFMRAAWHTAPDMPVVVAFATTDRAISLPVPRALESLVARVEHDLGLSEEDPLDATCESEGLSLPDLLSLTESAESEDPRSEVRAAAPAIAPTLAPPPAAPTPKEVKLAEPPAENAAKPDPKVLEPKVMEPKAFEPKVMESKRDDAKSAPPPIADKPAAQAERLVDAAEWRAHALELDRARGPKPVAAIERLFQQHYVPLIGAMARGEADGSVRAIANEWSRSFAESYNEAFAALKVTGKRPTMVLDAFDAAGRIARLSSARSVKCVLVDSMSFDLGERVAVRMKTELDKRAVLVERTTLWSALPSTTPTQMQLLGKGAEGLRESGPVSSSEPDVSRGRSITTMRRERLGSRELMKLDLVEARLHSPGAAYDERLDALADEVTDLVVMFMETLPPRTLVYLFGDHGFLLGPSVNGWATGPSIQGGASPEQVLVSGHAWLVDAMQ